MDGGWTADDRLLDLSFYKWTFAKLTKSTALHQMKKQKVDMLIYSLVCTQEAVSSLPDMSQGGRGQRTRGPSQHEPVARLLA